MLLTNLGAELVKGRIIWYKRKLKDWNCTKGMKRKISKSVGMWFNAIGLYGHVTGDVVWLHFGAGAGKRLDHYLLTRLPGGGHIPSLYSLSFLPCLLFLLAWLKLISILFPLSSDEIILRQFQFVLAANSVLRNQPTRFRFLTKWSYRLSPKLEESVTIRV